MNNVGMYIYTSPWHIVLHYVYIYDSNFQQQKSGDIYM